MANGNNNNGGAQSQIDSLIQMNDLQELIKKFSETYTMGETEAPSWRQTYTSQGGREQQQKLLIESLLAQTALGEGTYESRSKILGGGLYGNSPAVSLTAAGDFAQNRLKNDWNEISNRPLGQVPSSVAAPSPTDIYALIEQILKSQGTYK